MRRSEPAAARRLCLDWQRAAGGLSVGGSIGAVVGGGLRLPLPLPLPLPALPVAPAGSLPPHAPGATAAAPGMECAGVHQHQHQHQLLEGRDWGPAVRPPQAPGSNEGAAAVACAACCSAAAAAPHSGSGCGATAGATGASTGAAGATVSGVKSAPAHAATASAAVAQGGMAGPDSGFAACACGACRTLALLTQSSRVRAGTAASLLARYFAPRSPCPSPAAVACTGDMPWAVATARTAHAARQDPCQYQINGGSSSDMPGSSSIVCSSGPSRSPVLKQVRDSPHILGGAWPWLDAPAVHGSHARAFHSAGGERGDGHGSGSRSPDQVTPAAAAGPASAPPQEQVAAIEAQERGQAPGQEQAREHELQWLHQTPTHALVDMLHELTPLVAEPTRNFAAESVGAIDGARSSPGSYRASPAAASVAAAAADTVEAPSSVPAVSSGAQSHAVASEAAAEAKAEAGSEAEAARATCHAQISGRQLGEQLLAGNEAVSRAVSLRTELLNRLTHGRGDVAGPALSLQQAVHGLQAHMAQPLFLMTMKPSGGVYKKTRRLAMRNGTLLRVALLHEVRLAADALAADAAAAPGACTVASGGLQHTGSTTAAPADAQATTAAPGETDTAAAAVSAPAADALPAAHRDLALSGLQIVATELSDTVPSLNNNDELAHRGLRAEAAAGAGMALLGLLQRLQPSQVQQQPVQQQAPQQEQPQTHLRERTAKDQSPQHQQVTGDGSSLEAAHAPAVIEALERAQREWLATSEMKEAQAIALPDASWAQASTAGEREAGKDEPAVISAAPPADRPGLLTRKGAYSQQVIAERLLGLQQSLPALSSAAKAVLLREAQPVQTQPLQEEAAEGVPAAAGSVAVAAAAHVTPAGGNSATAAAAPLAKVQASSTAAVAEPVVALLPAAPLPPTALSRPAVAPAATTVEAAGAQSRLPGTAAASSPPTAPSEATVADTAGPASTLPREHVAVAEAQEAVLVQEQAGESQSEPEARWWKRMSVHALVDVMHELTPSVVDATKSDAAGSLGVSGGAGSRARSRKALAAVAAAGAGTRPDTGEAPSPVPVVSSGAQSHAVASEAAAEAKAEAGSEAEAARATCHAQMSGRQPGEQLLAGNEAVSRALLARNELLHRLTGGQGDVAGPALSLAQAVRGLQAHMAQPLNLRAPEGASQAVCRRAMRNGTLLRVALLHEVRLAADALAADAAAAPGACTVASGGQQHTGSTTAAPADAQATTAAPGETDTAAAAVSAPAADALPAAHRDLSLSGLQIVATELFDTVPLPRDYTALNGLSQRAEAAAGAGMALLGLLQRLHPSQLQQLQQQHPRERTVKDQSPQPRPAPDDRSISEPGRVSAALETLERAQQDWLSSPQLQRNEHLTVRFNVSKAGPTGAGYDPSSQQVIAERLLRLQQSLPALSSAAKAVLLRLTQPVQTQLLQAEAAEGVPAAAGSVAVAAAAHVTPAGGYSAAAAAAPLSKVQVTERVVLDMPLQELRQWMTDPDSLPQARQAKAEAALVRLQLWVAASRHPGGLLAVLRSPDVVEDVRSHRGQLARRWWHGTLEPLLRRHLAAAAASGSSAGGPAAEAEVSASEAAAAAAAETEVSALEATAAPAGGDEGGRGGDVLEALKQQTLEVEELEALRREATAALLRPFTLTSAAAPSAEARAEGAAAEAGAKAGAKAGAEAEARLLRLAPALPPDGLLSALTQLHRVAAAHAGRSEGQMAAPPAEPNAVLCATYARCTAAAAGVPSAAEELSATLHTSQLLEGFRAAAWLGGVGLPAPAAAAAATSHSSHRGSSDRGERSDHVELTGSAGSSTVTSTSTSASGSAAAICPAGQSPPEFSRAMQEPQTAAAEPELDGRLDKQQPATTLVEQQQGANSLDANAASPASIAATSDASGPGMGPAATGAPVAAAGPEGNAVAATASSETVARTARGVMGTVADALATSLLRSRAEQTVSATAHGQQSAGVAATPAATASDADMNAAVLESLRLLAAARVQSQRLVLAVWGLPLEVLPGRPKAAKPLVSTFQLRADVIAVVEAAARRAAASIAAAKQAAPPVAAPPAELLQPLCDEGLIGDRDWVTLHRALTRQALRLSGEAGGAESPAAMTPAPKTAAGAMADEPTCSPGTVEVSAGTDATGSPQSARSLASSLRFVRAKLYERLEAGHVPSVFEAVALLKDVAALPLTYRKTGATDAVPAAPQARAASRNALMPSGSRRRSITGYNRRRRTLILALQRALQQAAAAEPHVAGSDSVGTASGQEADSVATDGPVALRRRKDVHSRELRLGVYTLLQELEEVTAPGAYATPRTAAFTAGALAAVLRLPAVAAALGPAADCQEVATRVLKARRVALSEPHMAQCLMEQRQPQQQSQYQLQTQQQQPSRPLPLQHQPPQPSHSPKDGARPPVTPADKYTEGTSGRMLELAAALDDAVVAAVRELLLRKLPDSELLELLHRRPELLAGDADEAQAVGALPLRRTPPPATAARTASQAASGAAAPNAGQGSSAATSGLRLRDEVPADLDGMTALRFAVNAATGTGSAASRASSGSAGSRRAGAGAGAGEGASAGTTPYAGVGADAEALWRTPALPSSLLLLGGSSGTCDSDAAGRGAGAGAVAGGSAGAAAAAAALAARRSLTRLQREVNMRLVELLTRSSHVPHLISVMQLSCRHSAAIALPTQAALQLALCEAAPCMTAPQLTQVLQLVHMTRLYPPPLVHAAARRALELCGAAANAGASMPGAAAEPSIAGQFGPPQPQPQRSVVADPAAACQLLSQSVRCFARMSPAAELDGGLLRALVAAAASKGLAAAAVEVKQAVAGGAAEREAAPALAELSRQSVSMLERLVEDTQVVCDRLRPGRRNDVLQAVAPLRAALHRNSEASSLQALFNGVLVSTNATSGSSSSSGGGSGSGSSGSSGSSSRPSLAALQLLGAQLPKLSSSPGLSWLVARLLEAHEPYMDGSTLEPSGAEEPGAVPPWRVAEQLLRAAERSVFTVQAELIMGLQERVLRLPTPELMMLAARCEQLHLLPPHTLAAMLGRLRVHYSSEVPLEGGTGAGGDTGTSNAAPHDRLSRLQQVHDGTPVPASVALAGLVSAIERRMLPNVEAQQATGPEPGAATAAGATATATATATASATAHQAPPKLPQSLKRGVLAGSSSGSSRTGVGVSAGSSGGAVMTTSDPPLMSLAVAQSLASVLAAEAEAGTEAGARPAVPLAEPVRRVAGSVACALAVQALEAPPVRTGPRATAAAAAATASAAVPGGTGGLASNQAGVATEAALGMRPGPGSAARSGGSGSSGSSKHMTVSELRLAAAAAERLSIATPASPSAVATPATADAAAASPGVPGPDMPEPVHATSHPDAFRPSQPNSDDVTQTVSAGAPPMRLQTRDSGSSSEVRTAASSGGSAGFAAAGMAGPLQLLSGPERQLPLLQTAAQQLLSEQSEPPRRQSPEPQRNTKPEGDSAPAAADKGGTAAAALLRRLLPSTLAPAPAASSRDGTGSVGGSRLEWLLRVAGAVLRPPPPPDPQEARRVDAFMAALASEAEPARRQQQRAQALLLPEYLRQQAEARLEEEEAEAAEHAGQGATAATEEAAAAAGEGTADQLPSLFEGVQPLFARSIGSLRSGGRDASDRYAFSDADESDEEEEDDGAGFCGEAPSAGVGTGAALGVPAGALARRAGAGPARGSPAPTAAQATAGAANAPRARLTDSEVAELRGLGTPGGPAAAASAAAKSEARRQLLRSVRDRLTALSTVPDAQVLELLAPPPPPRALRSMQWGPPVRPTLPQHDAVPHRLPRPAAAAEAGAALSGGLAALVGADDVVSDSVRQLFDEMEVELAVEAGSGFLSPAALAAVQSHAAGSLATAGGAAGGGGEPAAASSRYARSLVTAVEVVSMAGAVESRDRQRALWGLLAPPLQAAAAGGLLTPPDALLTLERMAQGDGAAATEATEAAVSELVGVVGVWLLRQEERASAGGTGSGGGSGGGGEGVGGGGVGPAEVAAYRRLCWAVQRLAPDATKAAAPFSVEADDTDAGSASAMLAQVQAGCVVGVGPVMAALQRAYTPHEHHDRLRKLLEQAAALAEQRDRTTAAQATDTRQQQDEAELQQHQSSGDSPPAGVPDGEPAAAGEAGAEAAGARGWEAELAGVRSDVLWLLRRMEPAARVWALQALVGSGAADGDFVEAVTGLLLGQLGDMPPAEVVRAMDALAVAAASAASAGPHGLAHTALGPAARAFLRAAGARLKDRTGDFAAKDLACALAAVLQLASALPAASAASSSGGGGGGGRAVVPAGDRALLVVLRRALVQRLQQAGSAGGGVQVAQVLAELSRVVGLCEPHVSAQEPPSNSSGSSASSASGASSSIRTSPGGTSTELAAVLDAAADAVLRLAAHQPSRGYSSGAEEPPPAQAGDQLPASHQHQNQNQHQRLDAEEMVAFLSAFGGLGYQHSGGERWRLLVSGTLAAVADRADVESAALLGSPGQPPCAAGAGSVDAGCPVQEEGLQVGAEAAGRACGAGQEAERAAFWVRAVAALDGVDALPLELLVQVGELVETAVVAVTAEAASGVGVPQSAARNGLDGEGEAGAAAGDGAGSAHVGGTGGKSAKGRGRRVWRPRPKVQGPGGTAAAPVSE